MMLTKAFAGLRCRVCSICLRDLVEEIRQTGGQAAYTVCDVGKKR
jgi:hypothetical protein